jgi:octaprenyl-diphosphate synthase
MSVPLKQAAAQSAIEILLDSLAAEMRGVNAMILQNLYSDIAIIPQVAQYLIAAGGKRLRPLLTVASARLCGSTDEKSYALAAAVEFIHTASLLHDDVVDESHQRRGQPSANDAFGNQTSVLVGDFLFARAFELMVSTGQIELLEILARASTTITEGEVLQLSLAGNIETREEDYLRVIGAKTAALFAAATEVGAVLGNPKYQQAMHDFGYHFGMAFQLIDDVLDYSADAAQLNKNLGDDFRDGKLTLPVILAIRAADVDERAFWQSALGSETHHPELFARARQLMQSHNVFAAVRERAASHAAKAAAALETLPPLPLRAQLLAVLHSSLDRQG